jgi:hypothetical protein
MIRIVGTEIEIDRARKIIRNGTREYIYSGQHYIPVKFRLFEALLMSAPNGATLKELVDIIYRDCPDGGPLSGREGIDVMFTQIYTRAHLKNLNLRLLKNRHPDGMRYSLIPE